MISRINLWSSPRNISTALMYSLAQLPKTLVVDEPLYAHYLRVTDADHPGKDEILNSQNQDGNQVVAEQMLKGNDYKNYIFKQMTHHLVELDLSFLEKMKNVLLIRDPFEIILSYSKVIPNPKMRDVGIEDQTVLMDRLTKAGKHPTVVDARQLLLNPKKVLTELCENLEVPFTEKMLNWKPGARKEDGVWAKYWYSNVHQSTGFQPYKKREERLPQHLWPLVESCQPFYSQLFEKAIKA